MRILIAEDDPTSALVLESFLRELGYDVAVARDGLEAFELVCNDDFRMVISDWQMPIVSGVELCRRIRSRQLSAYVYVILLTCRGGTENLVEGLRAGADDFITKPFSPEELRVRLRVGERIASLESRDLIIFSMARLAESRDPETGAHLERIRDYSRLLTEHLKGTADFRGLIDGDFVRAIYLTSPLHDIGKVGIPDQILLKPGRLSAAEYEIMKQHTTIGSSTLDAALQTHPGAQFLKIARDIAWTHHERYDGRGYPRRLVGEEIPLCGRIVALADVYDALTSKRVYKEAFSHEVARDIIEEECGAAFDPRMVEAFFELEDAFRETRNRLDDNSAEMDLVHAIPAAV